MHGWRVKGQPDERQADAGDSAAAPAAAAKRRPYLWQAVLVLCLGTDPRLRDRTMMLSATGIPDSQVGNTTKNPGSILYLYVWARIQWPGSCMSMHDKRATTGQVFYSRNDISAAGRFPPNAVRRGAVKICKKDGTTTDRTGAIMPDNKAAPPAAGARTAKRDNKKSGNSLKRYRSRKR